MAIMIIQESSSGLAILILEYVSFLLLPSAPSKLAQNREGKLWPAFIVFGHWMQSSGFRILDMSWQILLVDKSKSQKQKVK